MCSRYEQLRLKNLADNRRILAELGIRHTIERFQVVHKPIKRKALSLSSRPKKYFAVGQNDENQGSVKVGPIRRSCRLRGQEPSENSLVFPDEEEVDSPVKRVPQFRPNTFGEIEGVEVGTWWATRVECSRAGIHRPTVAGIHGSEIEGAYSIALSGGYEDDLDFGECFTYTGEGGRDLKGTKNNPKNLRTAPQSKDQTLTRGNLALSRNCELSRPVRVIRGYKLRSQFAPEEGYRFDGLYTVEKYWNNVGVSGFGVWKFALRRSPDQTPPPWTVKNQISSGEKNDESDSDSGVDSLDSDTASQHSQGSTKGTGSEIDQKEQFSNASSPENSGGPTSGAEEINSENSSGPTSGAEEINSENSSGPTSGPEEINSVNSSGPTSGAEEINSENSSGPTSGPEEINSVNSSGPTSGAEEINSVNSSGPTSGAEEINSENSSGPTSGAEEINSENSSGPTSGPEEINSVNSSGPTSGAEEINSENSSGPTSGPEEINSVNSSGPTSGAEEINSVNSSGPTSGAEEINSVNSSGPTSGAEEINSENSSGPTSGAEEINGAANRN